MNILIFKYKSQSIPRVKALLIGGARTKPPEIGGFNKIYKDMNMLMLKIELQPIRRVS